MLVDIILIFSNGIRSSRDYREKEKGRESEKEKERGCDAEQKVNTKCIHGENGCKSLVNRSILCCMPLDFLRTLKIGLQR